MALSEQNRARPKFLTFSSLNEIKGGSGYVFTGSDLFGKILVKGLLYDKTKFS